jgi:predicted nucleic acid-binding protein
VLNAVCNSSNRIAEIILRHPKVNCNRELLAKALPLYVEHPAISFADACLAAYAELQGVQILTFAKKLSRQSKHARLV